MNHGRPALDLHAADHLPARGPRLHRSDPHHEGRIRILRRSVVGSKIADVAQCCGLAIEEADNLELAGQQRRLVDHEGVLAAAYDDEIVHADSPARDNLNCRRAGLQTVDSDREKLRLTGLPEETRLGLTPRLAAAI